MRGLAEVFGAETAHFQRFFQGFTRLRRKWKVRKNGLRDEKLREIPEAGPPDGQLGEAFLRKGRADPDRLKDPRPALRVRLGHVQNFQRAGHLVKTVAGDPRVRLVFRFVRQIEALSDCFVQIFEALCAVFLLPGQLPRGGVDHREAGPLVRVNLPHFVQSARVVKSIRAPDRPVVFRRDLVDERVGQNGQKLLDLCAVLGGAYRAEIVRPDRLDVMRVLVAGRRDVSGGRIIGMHAAGDVAADPVGAPDVAHSEPGVTNQRRERVVVRPIVEPDQTVKKRPGIERAVVQPRAVADRVGVQVPHHFGSRKLRNVAAVNQVRFGRVARPRILQDLQKRPVKRLAFVRRQNRLGRLKGSGKRKENQKNGKEVFHGEH